MEKEIISFESSSHFETWLDSNHSQPNDIWMVMAKKGSGVPSITYAQEVDCAPGYGWIDVQKAKHDENSWLQYLCKRKKNSIWLQVNQKHVERLMQEGRMQEPGLHAIEQANPSAQWHVAYQPTRSREVPPELQLALDQNQKAKIFF